MDVLLWEQNQDHESETSRTQSHANKCFSAGADRRMRASHMHVAPLRRFFCDGAHAHTPEHQTHTAAVANPSQRRVFRYSAERSFCVKPVDERERCELRPARASFPPRARTRSGLVKEYVKPAVNKQVSSASGHTAPTVAGNGLPEQCSMQKI